MKVSCVWSLDRFSSSGFVYEGKLCVIFIYQRHSVVQVLYIKAHSLPSYTKPELLNLSKDHTAYLHIQNLNYWICLKITHSLPSYTKPELLNLSKDHWSLDRFSSSGFVYEGKLCVIFNTQPSYTKPELPNLSLINKDHTAFLHIQNLNHWICLKITRVSCVWSLDRFSSSGFVYEGKLCVIFRQIQ
jgi:hypothetical protein